MDKKLIFICLATGIATSVIGVVLFYSIFYISLLSNLLLPGLLFGIVLSIYYKDIPRIHQVKFTLISFITYSVSALTTFYLSGTTNDLIIIVSSTCSLPIITLAFDRLFVKLKNIRNSIYMALSGGLLVGIIMYLFINYVSNHAEGENGAILETLCYLLIFPLWQSVFASTIKVENTMQNI